MSNFAASSRSALDTFGFLPLALRLGGRGVAQRLLEDAYEQGRQQKGRGKQDMAAGRQRTDAHADQAHDLFDATGGNGSMASTGATADCDTSAESDYRRS